MGEQWAFWTVCYSVSEAGLTEGIAPDITGGVAESLASIAPDMEVAEITATSDTESAAATMRPSPQTTACGDVEDYSE